MWKPNGKSLKWNSELSCYIDDTGNVWVMDLAPWHELNAKIESDTQALSAKDAEIERLKDKVEGLSADLDGAVGVAYSRGAVEWAKLNYPNHPCVKDVSPNGGEENG